MFDSDARVDIKQIKKEEIMSAKWIKVWICTNCKEELTWNEVMDSHGVCPFCGAMSEGTVVKTEEFSRQLPEENPWDEDQFQGFTMFELLTIGIVILLIFLGILKLTGF
jgi:predicted RNA-binding Zn-ribbon protein involved in translation (DUF1610 family)